MLTFFSLVFFIGWGARSFHYYQQGELVLHVEKGLRDSVAVFMAVMMAVMTFYFLWWLM